MESVITTTLDQATQKIDLIDGKFTVREANNIINDVLDVKINFHKIHRLTITEGNQNDACEYDNGRINTLIDQRRIANEYFDSLRAAGKTLKITSTINISVED